MDRVFTTKEGERWVVDYKASRHEGADTASFLEEQLRRYFMQLKQYGLLLPDTKQGLYFPLMTGWKTAVGIK